MNIAEIECRVFLFEADSNRVDLFGACKVCYRAAIWGLSEQGKVSVCFN
jgi:hypothetical protein